MHRTLGVQNRQDNVVKIPDYVWQYPGRKIFMGFCEVCGAIELIVMSSSGDSGSDATEHDKLAHARERQVRTAL